MNRRKFIRSLLFAATAIAVGTIVEVIAAPVYAKVGKLGYKLKGAKGRTCSTCHHYKPLKVDGECVLPAMRNAMKAKQVLVKPEAICSMWVFGKKRS